MSRFSRLFALFGAAFLALALVATEVDARAGGGGGMGSRGMRTFSTPSATPTAPTTAPIQRSVTQPTQPGATAGGGGMFNRPGGLFGGGLLGGLAAGFIGAGLFGMLFGHGFMGGLGGFASILGLIIQVALVVIVARLAWGWWMRRNGREPAFASAPAGNTNLRNMFQPGGLGMARGGGGGGTPQPSSNISIEPDDFDAFEKVLGEVQTAYGHEDIAALRALASPEMVSYFSEDLARNASRGVANPLSDVKLLQGDLAEAWREGDAEYATVAMRYSLIDRMVERTSGRMVGGHDQPQEVTELWTFMRARGGNWMLSAIQQA